MIVAVAVAVDVQVEHVLDGVVVDLLEQALFRALRLAQANVAQAKRVRLVSFMVAQ